MPEEAGEAEPFTRDGLRPVCGICPSLRFPGGGFDVVERPSRECPFDAETGFRFTAGGVPVCVHPERVGLPAAPYATEGLPLPWLAPPPSERAGFVGWFRAALTAAPPDACSQVIEQAAAFLRAEDPQVDVAAMLREALS
ncbi:hypothetical protein RKE29_18235 [Streptomyces sp. B1866]|uniref:hypothetical protein n=1 Tax=Streptomyces sp. B1866 TaxID=3075431 RepID=UPI0028918076|nr:hypothetical protein [Streptomyces sp. B1866]MDT3398562.1 hypothetical protein [Streptomyces sp. B1866]